MSLSPQELASFNDNGFLVRKAFATAEEVQEMKEEMAKLLEGWDPEDSVDSVFTTGRDQHVNNEYFLGSADHIRFFLEPGAVNENGKIRSDIPKSELVNKVGHSLHVDDPVFHKYSNSRKVLEMVRDLGYQDPVLPQSMYIFKQPLIGGAVTSHQDSSFLHTTPRQTCLGMWLALDPATLENGCLWVRPGSHKEPLRRLFARTHEGGDPHFKDINMDSKGSNRRFIPVEVDAGDLVVFPGTVDHLSLPNTSPKQRHTYQLHLVEGPEAGITWSKENWLQYPAGKPFPSLKA
ncbi:phytanoyl-CoA dioxygenase domain containing protein [Perkinsus marinus ATCC 50983]|uniref:Phytanoyl-CoA dioxygenase domain containing protein n=1 Tax=Perkinsus marinus (strain ATCC 50983 / TXsc) TaxID=423536 RepID=C5LDJ0_PERM5|nr:phytanoyl-CoA dioxygenase domain containing protein [Perkinsus marinus ATCC 50983]EER05322.1 phytanoyl-CoA dioxygenase domain containing protein [Perkinsus marinus ATCC 50983]|eukprot:XP_002773506.1 phytanoyl-CoA dioxygenase domain containing protein [Perkinsus marinus ATCC 50983]